MQLDSPAKTNTINTSVTLLSQIATNLAQHEQQSLKKLDQAVLKYITNRNNQKLGPAPPGSSDTPSIIDHLSLEGLEALHRESQSSIMSLQKQVDDFNKLKLLIHESNLRQMSDIMQTTEGVEIIEFSKRLIKELSKFRDVEEFCSILVDIRKKNSKLSSQKLMNEIHDYIEKMKDMVSDEEKSMQQSRSDSDQINDDSADERNQKFRRIGKNGRVALLLDFIQ